MKRPLCLGTGTMAAMAAAAMVSVAVPSAKADLVNIAGDMLNSAENRGDFTGSIQYDFLGGSLGSLIVTLTNTSAPANGGYITGLIFNILSADQARSATLSSSSHPSLINAPGQSGVPFGDPYDAGAAIGGNFEGGGNPTTGVAVGDTGTFGFDVVATDASSLTASSFINGPYEFNFIVRFRGFVDGGSDKVPVPTPASGALLAAGGLVLGSRRRRTAAE